MTLTGPRGRGKTGRRTGSGGPRPARRARTSAQASRTLRPMMLPDAGSALARRMGARWWSVIPTHVQYFTRASLAQLRAEGKPVFVNMTAAWCITCLANEQTTLNTDRVVTAMQDMGITYMKGDWTNQDPEISRILDEFDRPSVPLYVLYPGAGRDPVILPQILTPSIVVDAFNSL